MSNKNDKRSNGGIWVMLILMLIGFAVFHSMIAQIWRTLLHS